MEEEEACVLASHGELLFMVGHMPSLSVILDGSHLSGNCRTKEKE
jgi:hypothetical protein